MVLGFKQLCGSFWYFFWCAFLSPYFETQARLTSLREFWCQTLLPAVFSGFGCSTSCTYPYIPSIYFVIVMLYVRLYLSCFDTCRFKMFSLFHFFQKYAWYFFSLHMYLEARRGWPGIWIAYTTLPPPPPPGGRKCFFYVFDFSDLCDNRTEEAYPHIKANNVTLYHIMLRKIYYIWLCNFFSTFVLFSVWFCTRSSAWFITSYHKDESFGRA